MVRMYGAYSSGTSGLYAKLSALSSNRESLKIALASSCRVKAHIGLRPGISSFANRELSRAFPYAVKGSLITSRSVRLSSGTVILDSRCSDQMFSSFPWSQYPGVSSDGKEDDGPAHQSGDTGAQPGQGARRRQGGVRRT